MCVCVCVSVCVSVSVCRVGRWAGCMHTGVIHNHNHIISCNVLCNVWLNTDDTEPAYALVGLVVPPVVGHSSVSDRHTNALPASLVRGVLSAAAGPETVTLQRREFDGLPAVWIGGAYGGEGEGRGGGDAAGAFSGGAGEDKPPNRDTNTQAHARARTHTHTHTFIHMRMHHVSATRGLLARSGVQVNGQRHHVCTTLVCVHAPRTTAIHVCVCVSATSSAGDSFQFERACLTDVDFHRGGAGPSGGQDRRATARAGSR